MLEASAGNGESASVSAIRDAMPFAPPVRA